MADILVQSPFSNTVGTVAQSGNARKTNAVLGFTFTAWKDATDTRLVSRSFLILAEPRQANNKAIAAKLNQELAALINTKRVVAFSLSHPDVFTTTQELSLVGHIFP